MVKLSKKFLGQPMILEFLDHSAGMAELVKCRAIGWPIEITKEKIVLAWWDVSHKDAEIRANNIETCTIIQSALTDIILLK